MGIIVKTCRKIGADIIYDVGISGRKPGRYFARDAKIFESQPDTREIKGKNALLEYNFDFTLAK